MNQLFDRNCLGKLIFCLKFYKMTKFVILNSTFLDETFTLRKSRKKFNKSGKLFTKTFKIIKILRKKSTFEIKLRIEGVYAPFFKEVDSQESIS